jgi:hypothetical protein
MHARHYVPQWGRFLSVDPGQDKNLRDAQSWNWYAYTVNNPVNQTDPTGKYVRDVMGGEGATAALLASAYWGNFNAQYQWLAIVFKDSFGKLVHEGIYKVNQNGNVVEVWEHNSHWAKAKEKHPWKGSLAQTYGWTPAYVKELGGFFSPVRGLTEPIDHLFEGRILQCSNYSHMQQEGRVGAKLAVKTIQWFGAWNLAPYVTDRVRGWYSIGYKPWNREWKP